MKYFLSSMQFVQCKWKYDVFLLTKNFIIKDGTMKVELDMAMYIHVIQHMVSYSKEQYTFVCSRTDNEHSILTNNIKLSLHNG